MREKLALFLAKYMHLEKGDVENIIEIPPSHDLGDYAFPCFFLAKLQKKNPGEIAGDIVKKIQNKLPKEFERAEANGPYVNFFLNNKLLAENTIKQVLKEKDKYGSSNEGKGKTIVVEMSSPNIAKTFSVGHLRSTIIGNSLSKIFSFKGYKVVKINYLGDWGTQFGKLIAAYKRWGKETELKKYPIDYLLKLYVEFHEKAKTNKSLEDEARSWFKELEDGNKEALNLWKRFRELSIKEFKKTYGILDIDFDDYSGESFYEVSANKIIDKLRKKRLIKESEGALIVGLDSYGLGAALIRKKDGAKLYLTRDIAAAIDRYNKYKFNKMIYEVGKEQTLHFKQLFKILEIAGYKWSKQCVHVAHGLYLDKNGKKLATREGKIFAMENLLKEATLKAFNIIQEKNPGLRNKDKVAEIVGIGAIIYGDLKNERTRDAVFELDRFISFEGNTGPYLQYSYARASSIIRKSKKSPLRIGHRETQRTGPFHSPFHRASELDSTKALQLDRTIHDLNESEIKLAKKIALFPSIVDDALKGFYPSLLANYAYELAQIFNEFYHLVPVIESVEESFRLALINAFCHTIKNALALLGIKTLEEM
ncbi:arginine--tRNA ligase [Candidatus Pacearchaeota archaeon]|nr:arginine--tRNA ligase [Candidatus Pacearchaeota archaeon]